MGHSRSVAMSMIFVLVSVGDNFARSSTAVDDGYHFFGEWARFNNCWLQKINKASSLLLVEQWEERMTPRHSRFLVSGDKDFFLGLAQ